MKSKTKNLSIPLNSISRAILEKYDYALPSISNQKMNKFIKEVFQEMAFTDEIKKTMRYGDELIDKKSEFWERISSHTARRSFITIMKNKRVPDKVIMSYTGHTSLEVFNAYYRPSEEEIKQGKDNYRVANAGGFSNSKLASFKVVDLRKTVMEAGSNLE